MSGVSIKLRVLSWMFRSIRKELKLLCLLVDRRTVLDRGFGQVVKVTENDADIRERHRSRIGEVGQCDVRVTHTSQHKGLPARAGEAASVGFLCGKASYDAAILARIECTRRR